jgi:hypothetical protein
MQGNRSRCSGSDHAISQVSELGEGLPALRAQRPAPVPTTHTGGGGGAPQGGRVRPTAI